MISTQEKQKHKERVGRVHLFDSPRCETISKACKKRLTEGMHREKEDVCAMKASSAYGSSIGGLLTSCSLATC